MSVATELMAESETVGSVLPHFLILPRNWEIMILSAIFLFLNIVR